MPKEGMIAMQGNKKLYQTGQRVRDWNVWSRVVVLSDLGEGHMLLDWSNAAKRMDGRDEFHGIRGETCFLKAW